MVTPSVLLSWGRRPRRAWLLLIVGVLILAAAWTQMPPSALDGMPLQPPGVAHWLGTDALGEDVLLRLIRATPNTLLLAVMVGFLPVMIGLLLASLAVMAPIWVDRLILKLTDVLLTLPAVLILVLMAALGEPGLWGLIAMLCAIAWMDDLRVLRASMLREQQRESVEIARAYGASPGYLLLMHVWPAQGPVILALFVQNARRGVLQSAGVVFLGLTDPRVPGWGNLLYEAQDQIHAPAFWWLLLPPLVAIALLLFSLSRFDRVAQALGLVAHPADSEERHV